VLRALIFDFDGVIADDEGVHLASFQRVFAELGIAVDRDAYYARYLGYDDRGCVRAVLADHGRPAPDDLVETLVARKGRVFLAAVTCEVRIFPGVPDFVRRAAAAYPLAIASGALRHEIDLILRHAGLDACFRAIVSADDVAVGKPDPAVFRAALAALNGAGGAPIRAAECLVIEDSLAGIEGARRAEMRCLAVANSYALEALGGADLAVASLEGLALADLEALCRG
jgi:beta-phosphoglucomutase